jgi:HK97 family phage portal protein
MAFWRDLFSRLEKRSADGWGIGGWALGGWGSGYEARASIQPAAMQSLSAVTGGIELIASAVASLPASLVVDTPDGRKPAPASAPQWRLLARPSKFQSWASYIETVASSILIDGNSVTYLPTDGRGVVTSLIHCPWRWLLPMAINGRLVFDLVQFTPEAVLLEIPRRMLDSDVAHVKARSDNGILGISALARASNAISESLDMAKVATSNWKLGLRPSGVFSIEGTLDKEARKRFREAITESNEGPANAGRMIILDRNGKFTPTQMTSADSEFQSARMLGISDVARILKIPEPMLQIGQRLPSDMSTFVTTFATQALAPIVNAIEQEFDVSVLPGGMHLVLDMSGLMRGSYSAAVGALSVGKQAGIYTANDARRSLGLEPVAGGDVLGSGPAPNWPADHSGVPHLGPSPGPGGGGDPGNHGNEGAA